jgi:hypothetical protein
MPIDTFALKVVVTPLLIAGASLAGRRWGQSVSGWLVGLPLTSGPVAFFLALEHGIDFAVAASLGSLTASVGETAFCVAYGHIARRSSWVVTLACACVAFTVATLAVQAVPLSLVPLALGAMAILALARLVMPRGSEAAAAAPLPRWDIPARLVITTALVVLLTEAAPIVGPRVSGVLATFPLYAAIMTVFAHRLQGVGPGIRVLHGLLLGLFAFCGFFLVLGVTLPRTGLGAAFTAAIVAALAIQGASLGVMLVRRSRS